MWQHLYTGDVWKLMTHQLNPTVRMLFMELSMKVRVCVCLALCVCVIVCTVSVVTCVLSPREPHLFPSYCALKTSTCAARPDSCHFEQTRAAQWRPDENDMNEMKHQVQ